MLDVILARSRTGTLRDEVVFPLAEQQFATVALHRLFHSGRPLNRSGQLTLIYGDRGTGKSLLIREALRQALGKRLRFAVLPAVEWLDLFAKLSPQDFEQLQEDLQTLAFVGIEDLDRGIADVEHSEMMARWLDRLLSQEVRVAVTLSQPASSCSQFSPRLVSRLHAGLQARIPALSNDSARQLVTSSATLANLSLSEPVVDWLSTRLPVSPRRIRRDVERLVTVPAGTTRWHDLDVVRSRLEAPLQEGSPSLNVIAAEVAQEFGVTVGELRGKSRESTWRVPRQCAMFLAHTVGHRSMTDIGHFFGRRTHTSVSYSCRKFTDQLSTLPTLREQVQRLRTRLEATRHPAYLDDGPSAECG